MRIEDFLNAHTIVQIGRTLPDYVCCEHIVDNPEELVPIVRESGCYISEILWWDRIEIGSVSSIGYGGPRDPRCPDSFFFAETDIYRRFNTILKDEEYYKYFDEVRRAYPGFDLFPGFDIMRLSKE